VTAEHGSRDVVVDTGVVVVEILVDREGTFGGSVLVDLSLDSGDGGRVDDGAGFAFGCFPGFAVSALLLARWD